jgi:hypothetical protein
MKKITDPDKELIKRLKEELKNLELKGLLNKAALEDKLNEIKAATELVQSLESQNKLLLMQEQIQKRIASLVRVSGSEFIDEKKMKEFLSELSGRVKNLRSVSMGKNAERLNRLHEAEAEVPAASQKAEVEFSQILSFAQDLNRSLRNTMNFLGVGTHTFAAELINTFGNVINLVSSVLNTINSGTSLLKTILGGVLSFIPGGGIIASMAGSGSAHQRGLHSPHQSGIASLIRASLSDQKIVVHNYFRAETDAVKIVREGYPQYINRKKYRRI